MKAYYGSRISENMTKTPEGFLICLNVPIARTGEQQYLGSELDILDEHSTELFRVIRSEDEVFAPATLASFEGKPVTDEHPPEWVKPDNITAFNSGHVQNVRRGTGEESDLIVADLFITDPKLIEAIENKDRREVSCGYDCTYEQAEDGTIYQRAIRGNHVAVVPAGRAGSRVAIKDSATEQKISERRKKTMANTKNHSVWARLFSHAVKDMEPDEVADAIEEITQSGADEEPAATPAPAAAPVQDQGEGELTLAGIMAAVKALTEKVDALAAAKDEEPAPAATMPEDEDPLQKLADELAAVTAPKEGDPADEEAAQTIPADELPDETIDEEGVEAPAASLPENPIQGADRAIALGILNSIKPVIAALPKEQRKAVSDQTAAEIRKLIGKDSKPKSNGYNAVSQIVRQASKGMAKDSAAKAAKTEKIGADIMAARNPHYKK